MKNVDRSEGSEARKENPQTARDGPTPSPLDYSVVALTNTEQDGCGELEARKDTVCKGSLPQAPDGSQERAQVSITGKSQRSEKDTIMEKFTPKLGLDKDLGDTFFSLSDQSSWSSDEEFDPDEGKSWAWKTSWSETGSETTTKEGASSEWGKGPDQSECFKATTARKKKTKRSPHPCSPSHQQPTKAPKDLHWDYSSSPGYEGSNTLHSSMTATGSISLEMIHQSFMEYLE
ncbi:hypothetical protein NDU88_007927 [Pleurodeles waltl]|uniref:Uncharacterized protein n=1 Tax=Pleurodeles waltl TaxID=8319 RepID=A0AAV7U252_PLEWA|nr:hypothetical protein NDU88_007927 [Pleurodeles waltl]